MMKTCLPMNLVVKHKCIVVTKNVKGDSFPAHFYHSIDYEFFKILWSPAVSFLPFTGKELRLKITVEF